MTGQQDTTIGDFTVYDMDGAWEVRGPNMPTYVYFDYEKALREAQKLAAQRNQRSLF